MIIFNSMRGTYWIYLASKFKGGLKNRRKKVVIKSIIKE